jgi:hypothetical protein
MSAPQVAARSVSEPTEIDWAAYKAKLPELDVDAIRADYEATIKSIPAIPYDEKADVKAHEAHEKVRCAAASRRPAGPARGWHTHRQRPRPNAPLRRPGRASRRTAWRRWRS